jgi:hypothetical protein
LHPTEPWLHRSLALAHWKRSETIPALAECLKASFLYLRRWFRSKT